ncbi:M16 family metallopeptidase [Exiguobacterium aestuarii]|uniref:M16 family metallopeptidase n=1 Tax=Exiguobacterium aestuarii TaxID=273527 RepID=A0ABW2PNJ7_9BACL|nr:MULTISPECIES: pitrilysin family protein [Exiguobacterium]MCT4785353.1 insulinase family protein [Exiguobacterium aestuarii]
MEWMTLQNGVRVIIEPIEGSRSTSTGVFIKAGTRTESFENIGISHLIEHMLFKGTSSKNAKEIASFFDELGGSVNAFTSKDHTCFYVKTLDEHAVMALDVLTDMLFDSVLDETELEKEKRVVVEEIKMYEDTPEDLVHELLAIAAYRDDILAQPILGTEESVNRLTRDQLVDYLQERYVAEEIVVSIAGHVSEELMEAVKRRFANIPSRESSKELTQPELFDDTLTKRKETEQAHLCWNYEAISATDDRLPHLALMNNAIGATMSSRLFQSIREEEGLAYSIYSYYTTFADHGTFTIYVGTSPDTLNQVEFILERELKRLFEEGLTDEEVDKGKRQLKGSLVLGNESSSARMNRNGRNLLLLDEVEPIEHVIQKVERIERDEVNALIREVLTHQPAKSYVLPNEA